MSTLATLRTNVSAILGLDNSTSGDQTQIDAYINEGVLEVLKATKCYVTYATASMTANSSDYTLDTDILEIRDVFSTSGSVTRPLERRSMDEILDLRRASSTAGAQIRYYALAGHNLLMVYPTPSTGETLTFYYVPMPTVMSNSAHDPSSSTYGGIPSENHNVIEWYALWRLADMDDDSSSEQGMMYRESYLRALAEMKRHLRFKGGYRLAPARLRSRRVPAADPSTSPAYYP